LVALGLLLATSAPAAADFRGTDPIEPNFHAWSFTKIGAGSAAGYTDVNPRSGVQAIRLTGKNPGYALTQRPFFIGQDHNCHARIWVNPINTPIPVPVNFEIVDPSTGNYIALTSVTLPADAEYTAIDVSFFTLKQNVDVRVAVGTTAAGQKVTAVVDDLLFECF